MGSAGRGKWPQRRLWPGASELSGSIAANGREVTTNPDRSEVLHPSLVLTVCVPMDPKESTLATLGWLLVTLSAGIWLLAAVLCRRLSQQALAPMARMVASARDLNPDDPGWCLERAGTGDELDELGRAFNDLLSRLHIAYQRQRRFSGDASHQLRTPLTVLIGQIEVALKQERSGEEYRRVLKSALSRAVLLGQIVEALLFLGRADSDAQLPGGERLDLDRWVSEYLADRPAPAGTAEHIHHFAKGEPLVVRVHPPLLGQLLDNLLDNARKYGKADSPILVETFQAGDMAILAVEDSGQGIPAEDLHRIFEPFYRSATGRRRSVPGVGLGLAVVHRIATAFGGTVAVRSEVGAGSRFEVRLPVSRPALDSKNDVQDALAAVPAPLG